MKRFSHSSPTISVVIVTFNSRSFIDRCLAPLATSAPEVEVIVWDNASSDGTAEHVGREYPWVRLFASPENLGFSRGNNAAFAECTGRYVLLLNPDAFLDSLEQVFELAEVLETDPQVGAVGPQLLHADGSHQVGDAGWRPRLVSVTGHFLLLHRASPAIPSIYLSNASLLRRARVDVDWLCGACMMVRKEVIDRTGGFDASIFMYGEDMEWGERIRDAGHRVVYLPQTEVVHLQGASQRADGQTFYSTRYLDQLFLVLGRRYGAAGLTLMRTMMAAGFVLRAGRYYARAWGTGASSDVSRARNMWRYARHTLASKRTRS